MTARIVVVTAAAIAAYVLLDDPVDRAALGHLTMALTTAAVAWACVVAAPGGRRVTVPLLLAVGLVGVGEGVAATRADDGLMPYPNAGEGFILLGTGLMLLALLLKVGRVRPVTSQERLDIAIGSVSMLLFALLSGVFTPTGSVSGLLVATPFLLFGVTIAATNVLIVARPDPHQMGRWSLVACLGIVAGDVGFYADVRDGFIEQGRLTDVAYLVARGAIVGMALSMRPVPPSRPVRHHAGRQQVILAGAFALLVPVGAVVGGVTGADSPIGLVLLAGCVTVALLTWRAVMAVDELATVADRDHLTGLANRRRLMAVLDHECRHPGRFVLLVCDLDGFKQVNDRLGHAAGDQVLLTAAEALRDAAPSSATVARLGGDEFAVLLPGATDPEAARDALVAVVDPRLRQEHDVGMSAGGAQGGPGERPDDVLAAADRAMYAHKQAAR